MPLALGLSRCLALPCPPPPRRLRATADAQEDVDAKMRLRRLFRSLQGVDDEVTRYNSMLAKFLEAKEDEWEAIVAVYRGDLQKPFFEHMQVRATGGQQGLGWARGRQQQLGRWDTTHVSGFLCCGLFVHRCINQNWRGRSAQCFENFCLQHTSGQTMPPALCLY